MGHFWHGAGVGLGGPLSVLGGDNEEASRVLLIKSERESDSEKQKVVGHYIGGEERIMEEGRSELQAEIQHLEEVDSYQFDP